MKYIKMTQDLSLKLNDYIDSLIIKYAMFDSNFTDEYLYYKNANYNEIGIINNYIYAIEDNDNYIGYLVLNLFKDDNKI